MLITFVVWTAELLQRYTLDDTFYSRHYDVNSFHNKIQCGLSTEKVPIGVSYFLLTSGEIVLCFGELKCDIYG